MNLNNRTLALVVVSAMTVSSGSTLAFVKWQSTDAAVSNAKGSTDLMNDPAFSKLAEAFHEIKSGYFQKVDDQKLIDGAINGMVQGLDDPFSAYMDKSTADQFQMSLSSSFEGIGAEIKSDNSRVTIVSPYKGSPAEKAGLRTGDQIRKADGKSLDGMDLHQAVLLIRGKKGTTVQLEITRPGSNDVLTIPVTRDEIPLETVYAEMLPGQIGKIQITSFSENTADRFAAELKKLESKGMKGLIIDVRDDPGGYLDAVNKIGSLLIPNKGVILQVEDRSGKKKVYNSTLDKAKYPMAVLINEGSASASEILAAALHESGGYPLIGEKSYGKGTVQTSRPFDDGSNLKYTIAKWLTPKGNWIHKKGIEPDYKVALPSYFKLPIINASKSLSKDENSSNVKVLQQFLTANGFVPGREDGYFSQQTEDAVKAFQRTKSLPATGVVDAKTATTLMDDIRNKMKTNDTQLQKAIDVVKSEIAAGK